MYTEHKTYVLSGREDQTTFISNDFDPFKNNKTVLLLFKPKNMRSVTSFTQNRAQHLACKDVFKNKCTSKKNEQKVHICQHVFASIQ